MPRMISEEPEHASAAEALVWRRLSEQLPDDAVVIAGQRIASGSEEIEIDVLVLWPGVGIAVIEVKGGVVDVRDGVWRTHGRGGVRELKRSPVEQARQAKHALLDYLRPRTSQAPGRAAHLAILPHTALPADWDVPEARRSQVLDSSDLPELAGRISTALRVHAPDHLTPLNQSMAEVLVKQLRRTHRANLNHQLLAAEIEDAGNVLTREQERVIALLRFQSRAQITGGAGSGKTHLAMIKARELARTGHRTALLCYSRGLARHFQLLALQWPETDRPAFIGLFHDLPISWGAMTEEEAGIGAVSFYEVHLPSELARLAPEQDEGELFDAIVVDEAQDFSDLWWQGLLPCLRQGEDGILYVFTDEHQAVFDREGRAPITLNPFPLDDNLRNTGAIARTFAPLTALDQRARNDEGEPVRFVPATTEEAVATADDVVETLIDEGWDPGEIALLTTGRRHPEQRQRTELEGHEAYWDDFFAAEDVFYGHVLGAKGLERRVVVLAVNGFQHAEKAPHLLYVGLSRARALLVVVGSPQLLREVGGEEVGRRIVS